MEALRRSLKKPPVAETDYSDMTSQIGMMNLLRTGNMVIDTAVSVFVPLLFSTVAFFFSIIFPLLNSIMEDYWFVDDTAFVSLEYEFYEDAWGDTFNTDTGERNSILQKAVLAYITEVIGINSHRITQISLASKKNNDCYGDSVDQLSSYHINTIPPEDEYIQITDEIEFYHEIWDQAEEENARNGGGRGRGKGRKLNKKDDTDNYQKANKKIIYYYFRANKKKNGEKKIKEFVERALNWYTEQLKSLDDDSRYLYLLQKHDNKNKADIQFYKRYKLSDDKQFNGLFFPEKDNLLHLLNQFLNKEGKYEIPGYPHKLGLLLHGPPGTGKTSLIKALAQYTKRHVVSIPLSRITTNQELMDIVFDQAFRVKGADMPYRHSFSQVIYVMEDIDAASQIVLSREHKKPEPVVDESPMLGPLLEDGSAGVDDDTAMLLTMLTSLADVGGGGGGGVGTSTEIEGFTVDSGGWLTVGGGGKDYKKSSGDDKLDLAGLLNVLDGVVDCPGRLLVLTTNHPEKIDPALIRPGRVDKTIYLGYIQVAEAIKMIEHYFSLILNDQQRDMVTLALQGRVKHPTIQIVETTLSISAEGEPGELFLTPAELEQMCAESDLIEDFLTTLLNHSIFVESIREKELQYSDNKNPPSSPPSPPPAPSSPSVASFHPPPASESSPSPESPPSPVPATSSCS